MGLTHFPHGIQAFPLIGGSLVIQLANGPHRIVVNAIYESENAKSWACKPGCLFRHTGV